MGRKGYPASHWREVATIYRGGGSRPTTAIADHFQVSKEVAAKWVAVARSRRLLPATVQGRHSNKTIGSDRLRKVAKACGIAPEKLLRALRNYANGDLRVSPKYGE